ncbi:oxygen-independent coproporphyrinogen III oxidase [Vreelandella populi]|uniref:Coproporphyrinogen-III oxidase n=1 Tax=Vreelandella populi TaxID=2498858 RepID=A0A433L9K4_9GAMM|nr:oxygen-independent coproporphyrinogen III oxidase [Halomonas populi]RUR36904.1 oxygen-independent coproporphyrinogen III oxidase [Halomonas populi]RUR44125.1 oxygen-independent coproporphyrinogen III oxidase [Halomonas populi]RUR53582.1 oxygen-independent coproporphyrinogen III oxidase [Halomonas populi]
MPACATVAAPADQSTAHWNQALLRRYDKSGPRYTSYPTALAFHEHFTADNVTQALVRSNQRNRPLSVYVHVPFCRKICFYCACNKIATKDTSLAEPYLSRLDREMVLTSRHLDTSRPVEQLHWGGGTPTFLSLSQMGDLIDRLDARFGLSSAADRDYAIEIDPREADVFTLRHLQSLGFNRLSLGVQDLAPQVQKAINRHQPRVLTETLMDEAHRLGFRSLNLDLIYGLPFQTEKSFSETLEQVIELSPARLSVFNYAHMPERFKPQRRIQVNDLPSAEEKLAILRATIERLTAAGYIHIGMDHFAKPNDSLAVSQANGTLQRNFQGYSSHAQCDLIGLGVSAISRIDDIYAQNPTDLASYEAALDQGRLATIKGVRLTKDDLIRADVIERLMCDMQLDLAAVGQHWKINAFGYFTDALEKLRTAERDGLITWQGDTLSVTPIGRLLIRHLAMAFDTYLLGHSSPRYSKIV